MTQHGNHTTDQPAPDAPVVIERDGGVATVRFNRPDAMNSLSVATKEALLAALTEVAEDHDVRCVVLTGTGRAFCVGQDLREHVGLLKGEDPSLWETVPRHYNPVVELLATMDKPVVAAINGVAAGAGAAFAMCRRLPGDGGGGRDEPRLRRDRAVLRLGVVVVAAAARRPAPGRRSCCSCPRTVPAAECLELGLVTKVVAAEELEAAVGELARPAGRGADAGLRLDPARGRVQRRPRPVRLAGARGRADGAHRRERGPPGRRGRLPRQGEAAVHRPLRAGQGGVAAHGTKVSRVLENQKMPPTSTTATTATRRRQWATTDAPLEVRIATDADQRGDREVEQQEAPHARDRPHHGEEVERVGQRPHAQLHGQPRHRADRASRAM